MYNVIFAKVGGSPKTIQIEGKIELIDLVLDNPGAFISINGQGTFDWVKLEKDKRVNRYLKLRKLKKASK